MLDRVNEINELTAKQSKAKQSKAKQSKAKQSKAKQSKAKQSKAKQRVSEVVGGLSDAIWGKQFHQQDRVYSIADVAQCISAQIPGGAYKVLEIKNVLIKQATKEGAILCNVPGGADLLYPESKTRRGRVINDGDVCPTICAERLPYVLEDWVWEVDGVRYLIRIRKLTPKETWALMDFNEGAFEKAAEVNSSTQLYKEAGNSIVVNCLVGIIGQMIEGCEDAYTKI